MIINFLKKARAFTLILLVSIVAITLLPTPAFADNSLGYSHDSQAKTTNPQWMSIISSSVKISELSIPGTHDTMALYGGDIAKTQSMSLRDQLKSGIRALDIRCRRKNNLFDIYHGIIYQNANFDDVLRTVTNFLNENPSETVLMRVKQEESAISSNKEFDSIFKEYWDSASYGRFFWHPTTDNPTLGEVRGKIVVLQNFSSPSTGINFGIPYPSSFSIQDDYGLSDNWDLYSKWEKVKNHLNASAQGSPSTKYVNYLSGSGGSFPYFVASGHSNPATGAPRLATGRTTPGWNSWKDFPRVDCVWKICTIAFEGTNNLTLQKVAMDNLLSHATRKKLRTGIVFSDFPGPGLIDQVIRVNPETDKIFMLIVSQPS